MTLGFEFHPEAQAEFDADVDWHDDREFGAGGRFAEAVRVAIDAARESPESWAKWSDWDRELEVRSKGVETFPYRVVYVVRGESLVIVAVAHAKRRPGYWKGRVSAR